MFVHIVHMQNPYVLNEPFENVDISNSHVQKLLGIVHNGTVSICHESFECEDGDEMNVQTLKSMSDKHEVSKTSEE